METIIELPDEFVIGKGSHAPNEPNGGFEACVMEAVSYIAGEPWSVRPKCASPLITSACTSLNDTIKDDAYRTQLLHPLIPHIVGTRDNHDLQRSYLALNWLVRVYLPAWLSLTPTLETKARELRDLPPIVDAETFGGTVHALLEDICSKSAAALVAADGGVAALAAADAAARAAVPASAGDIAEVAAWAAADPAVRNAIPAAAGDAARVAAWAAADKLTPKVRELQASFAGVLRQMCELGDRP